MMSVLELAASVGCQPTADGSETVDFGIIFAIIKSRAGFQITAAPIGATHHEPG